MPYYPSIVAAIALALGASSASAEKVEGVANYAYAVFVGTGVYSIHDRDIYVLRMPLAFDLYEDDAEADRKIGLRLLAPVTIGVTHYEYLEELPELCPSESVDPFLSKQIVRRIPDQAEQG